MSTQIKLNILIIEDELPAAEKLERYLTKYSEGIKVVGHVESIQEATDWLRSRQNEIDLIFMDIQLKDGLSFSIFQAVEIVKPVIFITAYNEFALDAFKVNGIDYLLKPITFTDLAASLQKLENLSTQLNWSKKGNQNVIKALSSSSLKNYKTRFMVKLGDHIRSITAEEISFFFADGRDVYMITTQQRKFIIDYTLEGLEDLLDPKIFFRVNRSYILNISAISDVVVHSNSRLRISSHGKWDREIIVSRDKVSQFKQWFDGQH